jgi:outer membrane protein
MSQDANSSLPQMPRASAYDFPHLCRSVDYGRSAVDTTLLASTSLGSMRPVAFTSGLFTSAIVLTITGSVTVPGSQAQTVPPVPATAPAEPAAPTQPIEAPATSLEAWAGPAQATSLPELLAHAVKNLPSLATAKYDISIAEAQMEIARARHDYLVDADLTVVPSELSIAGMTQRQTRIALQGGVTRQLAAGGSLSLRGDWSVDLVHTDGQPSRWSDGISGIWQQPILRGRGRALNALNERRAALARNTAVVAQQQQVLNVVQSIVSAYWDLVLAESELDIARSSLALANERLRVTQLAMAGGKLARNDDLPVLQAIATRQEEVLAGELAVVSRSIALRRAAGFEIAQGRLSLRVDPTVGAPEYDSNAMTALINRASAQSPELAQLGNRDKDAVLDVEVAQNGLLPQLDFALTLGPTGDSASFGGAVKNLVTDPGLNAAAGLTYRQSLQHRDISGRLQVVNANRNKLRVSAQDVKAQIAAALTIALGQVELARGRIALSQRTIELAQRNIDNEIARVTLGKSTQFDVLQRQEELKSAQLRRARALIDAQKAIASIRAVTGELLPFYGVSAPR